MVGRSYTKSWLSIVHWLFLTFVFLPSAQLVSSEIYANYSQKIWFNIEIRCQFVCGNFNQWVIGFLDIRAFRTWITFSPDQHLTNWPDLVWVTQKLHTNIWLRDSNSIPLFSKSHNPRIFAMGRGQKTQFLNDRAKFSYVNHNDQDISALWIFEQTAEEWVDFVIRDPKWWKRWIVGI